ncbi:CREB/ATF bZIP transcription factor [Chanos chanos]|uniref:X-box-binding protein 1 n=1 Tax=Chanos chanos TaxID=29144 RepID=A0A6J2WWN2_CHACN|nr:CREB/ATF bZIP transcription factor [Chanos chanos]
MITRKRGRLASSDVEAMHSSAHRSEDDPKIELVTTVEQTLPGGSETSFLELDDLLTSDDFSWELDDDVLSAFDDVGLQCSTDKFGGNPRGQDLQVDVYSSQKTTSAQRAKFQKPSGPVINKNAIAARMNRLRKKEYVNGLERKVGALVSENRVLKQENGHLNQRVEELENETRYLRAVLANESMLAQLLSRLSGVNGMKFSTSLFQGSDKNDHDYAMPRKRMKTEEKDAAGGVCLHVDKDHVSVEFCTKCAESASTSLKM